MIQTTLEIPSVATGCMYTKSQIMAKTDFIMTDSTSHNVGVIQMVCEEVENEYVPSSLLSDIHPLMMMQHKGKLLFQVIHDKIRNNETNKCFTSMLISKVNLPFKAIRCLIFFMNRNFSTKPWNRQKHFDAFIHPKKN